MRREISEIEEDLKTCGIPTSEAKKIYNHLDCRERNFVLTGIFFGTSLIAGALFAARPDYAPTNNILKEFGFTAPFIFNYIDPVIFPVIGSLAFITRGIRAFGNDLRERLYKTAENERARNRGEALPHDENVYNPAELVKRL